MNRDSTGQVEPIFVTVADAAVILGLKPWSVYQLLKAEPGRPPVIRSVKQGGRRSVVLASLRDYASRLEQEQSA